MADKKISIEFKASGAGQVASEAAKVKKSLQGAVESAADFTEKGKNLEDLGKKLLSVEEAIAQKAQSVAKTMRDGATAIGGVTHSLEEMKVGMDDASKSSGKLDERMDQATRARKAEAIGKLAGELGKVGDKFITVADTVSVFDQKSAESLRRLGEGIKSTTSLVGGMAVGFAAGGPAGAALAGITSAVGILTDHYADAVRMAVELERQSIAGFRKLSDAIGMNVEKRQQLENERWLGILREERQMIEAQGIALERNREKLAAITGATRDLARAEAEAEIAIIDADDAMPEDEKIRKKNEIRQRMERVDFDNRMADDEQVVIQKEVNAKELQESVGRMEVEAGNKTDKKNKIASKLNEYELKKKRAAGVEKLLEGKSAEVKSATWKAQASAYLWALPFGEGIHAKFDEDDTRLKEELEKMRNSAHLSPQDVKAMKELEVDLKKAEEEESAALEKLLNTKGDSAKATVEAEAARSHFEEVTPFKRQAFEVRSQAKKITNDAEVRRSQKRAQDVSARETDRYEAGGERERNDEVDQNAKVRANNILRDHEGRGNATARNIAASLLKGTNQNKLSQLKNELDSNAGTMSHQLYGGLSKTLEILGEQAVAPAPYVQPPINPAIQAKKESQAAVAREGVSLIPEGTDRRLREAIELAASGLQNGDQGGEMEDFLSLMEKLAETVSQSGKKGSSLEGRIQQLTTKISTMQQQISNLNGR